MEQAEKVSYESNRHLSETIFDKKNIKVNQKLNSFIHDNIKQIVGIRAYLYNLQNIVFTALNGNVLAIIGENKQYVENVYIKHRFQIMQLIKKTWGDAKITLKYFYIQNGIISEINFETSFTERPKSQIVYFNENDNKYTFDTFVSSDENITALEICQSIACFSQKELVLGGSIVFLYGETGTGKTHLSNAIGNFYRQQGGKVFNITANNFLRKYVKAVQEQNVFEFQDNILKNEILVIDNIDDLIGKNGTLSGLHKLLLSAIENKKYVVLTGKHTPKQLCDSSSILSEILINAMTIKLKKPQEALKTQVIMNYIGEKNLNVPISIVKDLILKLDCNIIELKNYVKKLSIVQSIRKFELNSNLAFEILADDVEQRKVDKYISNQEIIDIVANYYNFPSQDLSAKIKCEKVCRARNVAMYMMKKINSANFQEIGRALNRNHSTVIAGLRNVEMMINNDKKLPAELADIMARFEQN